MQLIGTSAVVTGGASGLGAATAVGLGVGAFGAALAGTPVVIPWLLITVFLGVALVGVFVLTVLSVRSSDRDGMG